MTDNRLLGWTEERIDRLKAFWIRGDSAAIIAGAMHITRNAVLGKVHRLGLSNRIVVTSVKRIPSDRCCLRPRTRKTVFSSAERKPRLLLTRSKPALMAVVSPITGAFITARRRPFAQRDYTKNELRAMLTTAVVNTAALEIIA